MNLSILEQIDVKNKSVLLRIDINSPVVKSRVLDNPRFEASIKTIKYLIKNHAKVAIIAHQGRKGDSDFISLKQHAKILTKYTKRKIHYINDLFGKKAQEAISLLKSGEIVLLKNVREYKDEQDISNPKNKYKRFCRQFDLYVNEAFSVCHRSQGSIILPPKYLSSTIGFELEKEIKSLEKFKKSRARHKVFILGGLKIEDYFPFFKFLKNKSNKILAAGVLGNLFLIARGYNLGYESKWIKSHNYFSYIEKLKQLDKKYKNQIILPVDFGLQGENKKRINVGLHQAPFKYKIYDVGEETIKTFTQHINKANFIFMKGPLGFSEIPQFSISTVQLLKHIAQQTKNKRIFSLLGGGHLTTTIQKYNIPDHFSYISLSGGALIKYISGEKLPGIEALR